jgi:arsenate reductase
MRRLLFVCTHNSARSILAEGLANHLGGSRLRGFSAGSHPSGQVNPLALDVLREQGCPIDGLHSKSWDVFAVSPTEPLDAVITVCDNAAHDPCPVWPGTPARVHWGLPDPSHVEGDAAVQIDAFRNTAASLMRRLRRVLSLSLDRFDPPTLQRELQRIHDVVSREERST